MIPHFIYMIKETGYTLHWVAYHNKHSTDLFIKFHEYAIALGVVCFDSHDIRAKTIVVPIITGNVSGKCLDEIPCHACPAAGVGCGVGDFGIGRGGGRPGDFAPAVGECVGESTSMLLMMVMMVMLVVIIDLDV